MEAKKDDTRDPAERVGVLNESVACASTSRGQLSQDQLSDAERLDQVLQGIQGDAQKAANSLDAMLSNIQRCLTNATEATKVPGKRRNIRFR
eukprot:6674245-Pyramimonas_sp.AAC.1